MALLRPIQGELALKFWASANTCNRIRAICAYSLDEEDANRNLTRYGYTNSFRKRVLAKPGIAYNNPTMNGIPYNEGATPLDECLEKGPTGGTYTVWDDALKWMDAEEWIEWIPANPYPEILEVATEQDDTNWRKAYEYTPD